MSTKNLQRESEGMIEILDKIKTIRFCDRNVDLYMFYGTYFGHMYSIF